ncbi:AAC(3) family N-acetyltransferase [Roseibium aggregatum]|uniref:AAC(3) family N-acetyltransferase n=1 Tax=Roseibium aggregatum TaxID=187304 RepID=UPI00094B1E6C|nr:AAC(3) family N-acetyltransferase [Roseibium aggregatum]UFI05714.1 AAC(3) family N-acetyltransferase [Roseibium aggregatum]
MIRRDVPLFVHSDMSRGMIAAKRAGARIDPRAIQRSLIDFLAAQTEGGSNGLIFPAFNYEYGSRRVFDVEADPVQVGALPEWMRQQDETSRTRVPFFSVLSKRDLGLKTDGQINPFGDASAFQWLVDQDANLALFGAPLHTLTFIHYVEEMSGGPVYRYDKSFPGHVISGGLMTPCSFSMHVRPKDVHLDYDWPGIEADLRARGLLHFSDTAPGLQWLNARDLLEYWGNQIAADPFHLLDAPSRAFFTKATEGGRNRVRKEDFENV